GTALEGRTWLASFSRYDYSSAEAPPVLSSTSPHAEVSFHRQQEWAELLFFDRAAGSFDRFHTSDPFTLFTPITQP
ncbi:MAG: hypothetical protein WCH43_17320, partial [Verrucomicrobiota bacterium]